MAKKKGDMAGIKRLNAFAINSELNALNTRGVIYSPIFPEGLPVEGKSETLIRACSDQLERAGTISLEELLAGAADEEII